MSYSPPSIGPAGLSLSSYLDILNDLKNTYWGIWGTAVYLGLDSADYQDLAVRALQIYDYQQALQFVLNQLNPQTAIGTGLDLCGKLIGTARRAASFSTCSVTLTGTPGAAIAFGLCQDVNGQYWELPPCVIGISGTVTVIARAQLLGNVTASIGQIVIIATPTAGWTSVTNAAAASPGAAIEPDSQYRARLIVAQTKPSLSLLAGTEAAVAAVSGVTRSVVYENQYGYTTGYGLVNTSGETVTLEGRHFNLDAASHAKP